MKYTHSTSYFSKIDNEEVTYSETFVNDLTGSDTVASAVVTCVDSNGTECNSLVGSVVVSSPIVTFKFTGGTAGETYQVKLVATSAAAYEYIHYITCEVFGSITLTTNVADMSANSYVRVDEANNYIRNKYGHSNIWDTLSLEGKKRVLIEAANDIEGYNYIGEKYYDNQSLQFPRDDHDIISGNCATPFTINSFSNSGFTSDTYGNEKSNSDYWKYGSVHITTGTPLHDIRTIETSNITTDVVTMFTDFTATPNANTSFIAFTPIDKFIKYAQFEQALYIIANNSSGTMDKYISTADKVKIDEVEIWFKKGASSSKKIALKAKKYLSRWIKRSRKLRRA